MIRRDRPADEIEEIEVTPAMIEAGINEMREHHYEGDVRYMLESVYRAMAYSKRSASSNRSDK